MIWTLKKLGTFEENLDRVAQAGFHHVELVGEFKKWSEDDYRRILARMQELKISVDATSGVEAGFADPSGQEAFLSALRHSFRRPSDWSASRSFCFQASASRELLQAPTRGIHRGVETRYGCAEQRGSVAVIEPIDRIENPTIYLDGVSEAFEIAQAVGSPNVRVLYDVYHEQREFGNLIEKFETNIGQVGLIHIADVPGRHEPGTGEINYLNIYRKLAELSYKGTIAMEFYPTGDIVETLRRARDQARSLVS